MVLYEAKDLLVRHQVIENFGICHEFIESVVVHMGETEFLVSHRFTESACCSANLIYLVLEIQAKVTVPFESFVVFLHHRSVMGMRNFP
jgi:hypothetical protein